MIPLGRTDLWDAASTFAHEQRRQWSGELSAGELHGYQQLQLAQTMAYCRDNSPFYGNHLAAVDSSTSFEDIPFTTKDHLRQHLDAVASLSLDQAWVYYETTGTTGASTPCPRSAEDSMRTAVALCEGYRELLAHYDGQLSIAVMGPTELHSTGDTFGDVFRSLGHCSVKMWPHSPVVGFERAAHLLRRLPIDGLTCTPGMAILLARHLRLAGVDPRELGIKVILTLGELTTPNLLDQIGDVWGADVHSCMYASQEASILAVCQRDGQLRTTPLNYFYEIVDPDTGAVLDPRQDDREGEIVVSHLYRGAKPLIRYRTGDIVRARGAGQDFVITPVGRARDELFIADSRYAAYDFEQAVLEGCPPFLDYQVTISNEGATDLIELRLEPRSAGAPPSEVEAGRHAARLSAVFRAPVTVSWGPTDSRTSTGAMVSWKAARIRDHRDDGSLEDRSARQIAQQRAKRSA